MFFVVKSKVDGGLIVTPLKFIKGFSAENAFNSGFSRQKIRLIFNHENTSLEADFSDTNSCLKVTLVRGFRK